jgi:hypothetical protein
MRFVHSTLARALPFRALRWLAAALIITPGCGQCDETWSREIDETLEGAALEDARANGSSDEERCENTCLAFEDLYGNGAVVACSATGSNPDLPAWDEAQSSVHLVCSIEGLDLVACTQ